MDGVIHGSMFNQPPKFTPLIIPSPQEELNGLAVEKEEVQHSMSNVNT